MNATVFYVLLGVAVVIIAVLVMVIIRKDAEVRTAQALRRSDAEANEKAMQLLRETQDAALKQQMEGIRSQMTASAPSGRDNPRATCSSNCASPFSHSYT